MREIIVDPQIINETKPKFISNSIKTSRYNM